MLLLVVAGGFGPAATGAHAAPASGGSSVPCPTLDSAPALTPPGSPGPVPTPGTATRAFGYSVAVSGDTGLVGAFAQNETGAAYVYVRSGSTWVRQATLTAGDAARGDAFGYSVALSRDTAVVGAIGASGTGAVYVFARTGTAWQQTAKLVPIGRAPDVGPGDIFGWSVAVSGATILVGAPNDTELSGVAYVFRNTGGTWAQNQKLTSLDGGYFGFSVALAGGMALVGEPFDLSNNEAGSAYLYRDFGPAFVQAAKLVVPTAASTDNAGWSVALSSDTAVIGAPDTDSNRGAVFIFAKQGDAWTNQARLSASDGAAGDCFGWSVSISGHTVAVGAPLKQLGEGSAYIFGVTGSTWNQQAELVSRDAASGDLGARSVSLSGTTALAGAPASHTGDGRADVYTRSPTGWGQKSALTAP